MNTYKEWKNKTCKSCVYCGSHCKPISGYKTAKTWSKHKHKACPMYKSK